MDTKKEVGTKAKHRRLKGRKRKHGHHKHRREFGGDYSDNNEWLSKCIDGRTMSRTMSSGV